MKKLLFAALALAGFAACSADSELNEPVAPVKEGAFTIFATQNDFDDTRVTIGLDSLDRRPTSLKWEATDKIKLTAVKNTAVNNLVMSIPEGGIGNDGKSATFQAASSILPVAGDSYYACYPPTNNAYISRNNEGKYGLYYTVPDKQSGLPGDAVVLFATNPEAKGEGEGGIPMKFSAVNSILFVKINNPPASGFSQLVLTDFNGKNVCGSIRAEDDELKLEGNSITIKPTKTNPYLKDALYIMMPGNLKLQTGYVLTYTTNDGKTMSFGYNAAEPFAPGTIYGVEVNWSLPEVTLGAKTTYSYAAAKNGVTTAAPAKANEMGSGTTIFFDNSDYASSYSGVQNAMVVDCGFIVDGVEYNTKNGVEKGSGKTFYMNNLTDQTKGDHTVQAFIKVKHNGNIVTTHYSATETLSVTGIPYSVDCASTNFSSLDGWETTGTVEYWKGRGWQTYYYYHWIFGVSEKYGALFSPTFYAPSAIDATYTLSSCYWTYTYTTDPEIKVYTGVTTGKTVSETNSKSLSHKSCTAGTVPTDDQYTTFSYDAQIPTGDTARISISDSCPKKGNAAENWLCTRSFSVKYKE